MSESPLRILQISTADICGGAETVARNLFQSYRERGYESWLAVGRRQSTDPEVLLLSDGIESGAWKNVSDAMSARLKPLEDGVRGLWRVRAWLDTWGSPRRELERRLGIEDFNYPGTRRILELPPQRPDIVHCHNLHGGYFDLRVLPWLSHQVPTLLTLHDAWLLSGHCAHSFDCERWTTGCGHCPDLSIYPAITRDATVYNWRRKRRLYAKSRLYVATPSRWLMHKVEQSMLATAIAEARVVTNGVDLSVFHPGDRAKARAALGIPQDAKVLLFVGNNTRSNPWKDYSTLEAAIRLVGERLPNQRLILVCLGESHEAQRVGRVEALFVSYQTNPRVVAEYYRAAEVYVHAAKADTFPNTVLESLACGTPVVATAVGGIPEQVKGLMTTDYGSRNSHLNGYGVNEATGILMPPGDEEGMAIGIKRLLKDDTLRRRMGENAARDGAERFDLTNQVDAYLRWYEEVLRRPAPQGKAQGVAS